LVLAAARGDGVSGQPIPGGRAALVAVVVLVMVAVGVYWGVVQEGNGNGGRGEGEGGFRHQASGKEQGGRGESGRGEGGLGLQVSGKEQGEERIPGWLRRDIDLVAQVEKYTAAHGGSTDLSAQFFGNGQLSAHLHLMAPEQFCPLHHHPEGYELSAIVSGRGFVRGDGPGGLTESALAPGDVVISTKGSRHEIGNRDSDEYLAALVIATPRFEGNLYVRESTPEGNGQSTVLPASGRQPDSSDILFAPWADVTRHIAKEPVSLPAAGTLVLYVRQGSGTLTEPGTAEAVDLSAPQLVITRNAPALLASGTGEPVLEIIALHLPPGQKVTP
jgi:quercetin dioxygenase-like cupin family protein